MDLLEDLKKSILNFNFVMTYLIHKMFKMLALLRNHQNDLKDSIFECTFTEYNKRCYFYNFFH